MVLAYHNIADAPGFYTLTARALEEHLRSLMDGGQQLVSVDEYLETLRSKGTDAGCVLVTFDDAFHSMLTHALPVLERVNCPAAVFAPTDFFGRDNGWDAPQNRSPIISEEELKTLAAHPLITIGSHTVSHRRLATLSADEEARELRESRARLEDLLDHGVDTLAYPYGQMHLDVTRRTAEAARAAGYRAAFTGNHSTQNTGGNFWLLNRVDVSMDETPEAFARKTARGGYFVWKQRAKRAVSFLKMRLRHG